MGRPPIGKVAMTGAERVRLHRLKHGTAKPVTKPVTIQKSASDEARIRQLAVIERLEAQLAERDRDIARLREELKAKPDRDDTSSIWQRRAMQAEENNRLLRMRKGLLTKAQFNHLRACLHTDSRKQISDAKLTQTRMAIEALENVLVKPKAS